MGTRDGASLICVKVLAGRDFEAALSRPPKIPPAPRRSCGGPGSHPWRGGWGWLADCLPCGRVVGPNFGSVQGRFAERGCHVSLRRCAAGGTRCFSEAKGLLPLRAFVPQKRPLRGWELRANEVRPDRNTRFRPRGIEGAAPGFLQAEVRGFLLRRLGPALCPSGILGLYPGPISVSVQGSTYCHISHSTGGGYYIPFIK